METEDILKLHRNEILLLKKRFKRLRISVAICVLAAFLLGGVSFYILGNAILNFEKKITEDFEQFTDAMIRLNKAQTEAIIDLDTFLRPGSPLYEYFEKEIEKANITIYAIRGDEDGTREKEGKGGRSNAPRATGSVGADGKRTTQ